MAEKKPKKIISASTGEEVKASEGRKAPIKQAAPVGNAGGLRVGAVVLWIVAIAFEVLAVLVLFGKINLTFLPMLYQLIIAIVLDLVCVIIGSQLWKKANHIDPASEANKVKFWLWNNMGLIVTVVAFVPLIILILTKKDADKKTKAIATVVAVIALLVGGLVNYDWNPVSAEEKAAAVSALSGQHVYWAPFGRVYHTHTDCQSLNQSEQLTEGTVEEAIAASRTRLCSFCAKRDDITGVKTDE